METRNETFNRLLRERGFRVLDNLRKIQNLVGPNYDWTPADLEPVFTEIENKLNEIRAYAEFKHSRKGIKGRVPLSVKLGNSPEILEGEFQVVEQIEAPKAETVSVQQPVQEVKVLELAPPVAKVEEAIATAPEPVTETVEPEAKPEPKKAKASKKSDTPNLEVPEFLKREKKAKAA